MRVRKTIFGRQKTKPNTFIGGVAASLNTASLVASKLGISSSRIKEFKIIGSNIEFEITGGSYSVPSNAFFNDTTITYYADQKGLVVAMGSYAYYGCTSLNAVLFDGLVSVGNYSLYFTGLTSLSLPSLTGGFTTSPFSSNTSLSSFSAPLLTNVSPYFLQGNTNMTTVNIPNAILTYSNSNYMFDGCSKLTNLTVANVTGLGQRAFQNCVKLLSLNLSNCTSVGFAAFSGCTLLANVVSLSNTTSLENYCFSNCPNLAGSYTVGVNSIGTGVFGGNKISSLTLPSLTSITGTMSSMSFLTNFYAPNLATIGATTGNNNIFNLIKIGVTLTVKASMATVNGGSPDGDLVYVTGSRSGTVIYV